MFTSQTRNKRIKGGFYFMIYGDAHMHSWCLLQLKFPLGK